MSHLDTFVTDKLNKVKAHNVSNFDTFATDRTKDTVSDLDTFATDKLNKGCCVRSWRILTDKLNKEHFVRLSFCDL